MFNITTVTLFLAFALGNIWKQSFFSPDVRVSFLDLSVGIIFILYLFKHHTRLFGQFRKFPVSKPAGMFAAIGLISLVVIGSRYGATALLVGSFYLVRWLVYTFFFLYFLQFSHHRLEKMVLVFSVLLVSMSVFQYLFFPDIRSLQIAEWDPHYFRVVGSLLDPGFMGLMLVLVLIYFTQNFQKHAPYSLIVWLTTYLAFAFTYSRSSYLSFIVGMGVISYLKKSKVLFITMSVLLVFTLLVLPRSPDGEGVKLERTSSIKARLDNWKHTLTIFRDNPTLGVGFNTYRYAQKDYAVVDDSKWLKSHAGAGADSSLLFIAATTGTIGLIAYIWYLFKLVGPRTTNHTPETQLLQSSLAALLIHSIFLNSLFYPYAMLWIALLIALKIKATDSHGV